jgi:acrylyl-CoA reductase (NADPH)
MSLEFRALLVQKSTHRGVFTRSIKKRKIEDLPHGDLLIRVHYSSLNFKDAMSCQGHPGVTRRYPHTPGIDAAGVIVESSEIAEIPVGESVVIAGTPLGMDISGGFGQYIRIPATWAIPLPVGLTLRESMIIGTAGLTAALSVYKLRENGVFPESGPVVVTGATGGVGSLSVAILLRLGYSVIAISGKPNAQKILKKIGECIILSRDEVTDMPKRSLMKEAWAGGIDTVGGELLSAVIKACKENGVVAATGLVGGSNLSLSVMPFILRGVSLLGINTMGISRSLRQELWLNLTGDWRPLSLEAFAFDCNLDHLDPEIEKIIAGQQHGRVVVNMK